MKTDKIIRDFDDTWTGDRRFSVSGREDTFSLPEIETKLRNLAPDGYVAPNDPHLMPDGTYFKSGYSVGKDGLRTFRIETSITNAAVILRRLVIANGGLSQRDRDRHGLGAGMSYMTANKMVDVARFLTESRRFVDRVTGKDRITFANGIYAEIVLSSPSEDKNCERTVVLSFSLPRKYRANALAFRRSGLKIILGHRGERDFVRRYEMAAEPTALGVAGAIISLQSFLSIVPIRGMYYLSPGNGRRAHDIEYVLKPSDRLTNAPLRSPKESNLARVDVCVSTDWDGRWILSLSFVYDLHIFPDHILVGRPIEYDHRPLAPMFWSALTAVGLDDVLRNDETLAIARQIFAGEHCIAPATSLPATGAAVVAPVQFAPSGLPSVIGPPPFPI